MNEKMYKKVNDTVASKFKDAAAWIIDNECTELDKTPIVGVRRDNQIEVKIGDTVYVSNLNCKRYGQKGIVTLTNFSKYENQKTNKIVVMFESGVEEILTINNISDRPITPYPEQSIIDDFNIWSKRMARKSKMTENELFDFLYKKKKCGLL